MILLSYPSDTLGSITSQLQGEEQYDYMWLKTTTKPSPCMEMQREAEDRKGVAIWGQEKWISKYEKNK